MRTQGAVDAWAEARLAAGDQLQPTERRLTTAIAHKLRVGAVPLGHCLLDEARPQPALRRAGD